MLDLVGNPEDRFSRVEAQFEYFRCGTIPFIAGSIYRMFSLYRLVCDISSHFSPTFREELWLCLLISTQYI